MTHTSDRAMAHSKATAALPAWLDETSKPTTDMQTVWVVSFTDRDGNRRTVRVSGIILSDTIAGIMELHGAALLTIRRPLTPF